MLGSGLISHCMLLRSTTAPRTGGRPKGCRVEGVYSTMDMHQRCTVCFSCALPDRERPGNSDYVTSARVLMSQPWRLDCWFCSRSWKSRDHFSPTTEILILFWLNLKTLRQRYKGLFLQLFNNPNKNNISLFRLFHNTNNLILINSICVLRWYMKHSQNVPFLRKKKHLLSFLKDISKVFFYRIFNK